MSRPRIFDPSERRQLHLYLTPELLAKILAIGRAKGHSASAVLRDIIRELPDPPVQQSKSRSLK